jgi:chromosome segregation ATPase
LRFAKEALETKLRKYLSHCQRLEEEKASVLEVLRSSQQGASFDGDIPKSVVSLCDKLASLEEECETLSKSGNQASFYLSEVEQLREHNSSLQSQISDSRKRVDRLAQSEIELKESLTSLRLEQDELRVRADRAQGTAESLENEKSRQVRYLEQENLQLMIDLKAIKKQLQNAKAELNMLRAKALDDDTMDITSSSVAPPVPAQSRTKPKVKAERAPPSTPVDKENSENAGRIASAKSSKRGWGSSLKSRRTPGLGESLEQSEENTQECKQS